MSAINGDKARFHRERKKKIARRQQMQKYLKSVAETPKAAAASSAKPKAMAE